MTEVLSSAAQQAAAVQAQLFAQAVSSHRSGVQALMNSRAGMCLASGWDVGTEVLDTDFMIDEPLLQQLMHGSAQVHAAPSSNLGAAPPSGSSALHNYLFPPGAAAPLGSSQRLGEEAPGAVYGPGNILGNTSAALAGSLQGLGERSGARQFAQGAAAILEGRVQRVSLGPSTELYNSAARSQRPRVRLRVRGLPVTTVRAMVPASGGPVTQWRLNSAGSTATLKVQSMTAQQLRNTAIMASEQRLPTVLRWASGRAGGGILTFGPSLALDAYSSIETDLQSGARSFNTQGFLLAEARSQSGNAVGFGAGMVVTGVAVVVGGAAAAASAPVILIALGVGVVAQVVWNWSGGADAAEGAMRGALR